MRFFILITFIIVLVLYAQMEEDADEQAHHILPAQGYTNIKLHGHSFFVCGDDLFVSTFTATAPNGTSVEGAVCCGFLKNCTVRFRE